MAFKNTIYEKVQGLPLNLSTIYLFLPFFVEVKSGVFEISRRFLFFMTSQICLFQIFDAVQRGSNFHKPISYNNHLRIPVSRCESQFRRIRGHIAISHFRKNC